MTGQRQRLIDDILTLLPAPDLDILHPSHSIFPMQWLRPPRWQARR